MWTNTITRMSLPLLLSLSCSAASAQETGASGTPSTAERIGMRQVMGNELLPTFENKTMEGIYNSYEQTVRAGLPPDTYTETHHDNATTLYEHRGRIDYTEIGIYQVKRDQICYTYKSDKNYNNGTFCFYIFKRDGCYYHFYEPEGFPKTEQDFENWTSMSFALEEKQSCLPNIA